MGNIGGWWETLDAIGVYAELNDVGNFAPGLAVIITAGPTNANFAVDLAVDKVLRGSAKECYRYGTNKIQREEPNVAVFDP
ncbi:hypothetical protein [Geobacter sp.]|uniref:hypothetical protein n=1 Tax=Geobacter sp. TaxID=46610 RepID=UPI0026055785|nr:hypothetical protein [Geobacter sp.]